MTDETVRSPTSASSQGEQTLTKRAFVGFLWIFSGAGVQAILKVLVMVVLARVLTPVDFGIVGAAMVVVSFAEIFSKIGVAPALVQLPDLTQEHIRTGFTLTVMFGLVAGVLIYLMAPMIAGLFRMPTLQPVIEVLALIMPIRSVSVVSEALVQRNMRFRAMATAIFVSYALGAALTSIVLALLGFGVWSLVIGQLVQATVLSAAFIYYARHSIKPMIQRRALGQLAHFGAGVTLARFGNYAAFNADYFVVGRWLGADALGAYTRAYQLLMQPTTLIGSVGDKVLYPALASVQDHPERMLRAYYRAISLVALAMFPLSAMLVVLGPEIIGLLLGKQWNAVILPFQILVASLAFRTAYKVTGTLMRAVGSVYLLAGWQWLYAFGVIIGAYVGKDYGLVGVAIGVSLAITASFWIGTEAARRACSISVLRVLDILVRYALVSIVIGIVLAGVKMTGLNHGWPPVVIILVCGSLGVILGCMGWLLVPRLFGEEGVWIRANVLSAGRRIVLKLRRSR